MILQYQYTMNSCDDRDFGTCCGEKQAMVSLYDMSGNVGGGVGIAMTKLILKQPF